MYEGRLKRFQLDPLHKITISIIKILLGTGSKRELFSTPTYESDYYFHYSLKILYAYTDLCEHIYTYGVCVYVMSYLLRRSTAHVHKHCQGAQKYIHASKYTYTYTYTLYA